MAAEETAAVTAAAARPAHVLRPSQIAAVDRGQGIRSIPLVGAETGSDVLLTGMTILPRGQSIALHTHSSDESVVLLEGRAICEIEGQHHSLVPFDTTFVASGTPHRFINAGESDMRILWIYSSVNTTRTFVETGETVPHLARYGGMGSSEA